MSWYHHRRKEPQKLNPIKLTIAKFIGGVFVGLGIDVLVVVGLLRSWRYVRGGDASVEYFLLLILIPIISGILFVLFFDRIMKLDKLN